MAAVPMSDFERQLSAYVRKQLSHARARALDEIAEMAGAFDEALESLRREKFKLEGDVKAAELKQLLHHQELQLLRDFDKR
eukprot:221868-Chlamydomonas_euryale.AAC.1